MYLCCNTPQFNVSFQAAMASKKLVAYDSTSSDDTHKYSSGNEVDSLHSDTTITSENGSTTESVDCQWSSDVYYDVSSGVSFF